MKQKIKLFLQFIFNPRFLLCVGLAWMITNGWSYLLLGFGTLLRIPWMVAVAGAYLAFLWLPISPEKIITFAISIALLRLLFPKDKQTLAVLMRLHEKAKSVFRTRKKKRKEQKPDQNDS